ncbi:MAG: NAD-dependent protein deacylase [Bacteroidaceae bacterium]|nr:NAD-dependent protein deacylase [Bacteroidaceae bacterium]
MQKLVILSGAGMSAESGFSTFRDKGGLWEKHPVEEVATPEGWARNPTLVTQFYNSLRKGLVEASPNQGHLDVAALERDYDVTVITQNVDDLHERAGSTHVIHLHGELMKMCSSRQPDNPRYWRTLRDDEWEVQPGTLAGDGSLLRPWIVWFGEAVPRLEEAAAEVAKADIFVIIGSSLNVYPAAGLVRYAPPAARLLLIDPAEVRVPARREVEVIGLPASKGVAELRRRLTIT